MATVFTTGDNNFATAKWIVNKTAGLGTHTSIAAALTSASSGDTIFIMPNTYTENLTLKAGVNLSAYPCDADVAFGNSPNVIILGKATATFAGTCALSGICLKTNSDFCLVVSGSSATDVELTSCFIMADNNTAVSFTSSSGSSKIELLNCRGNINTTLIAYFAHSGAGAIKIWGGIYENDGLSTTASTVSGSGSLSLYDVNFINSITTSSTGYFTLNNANFVGALIANSTAIAGDHSINNSNIAANTSSGLSVGAGATVTIALSAISSSNTNAITGAGTLQYSELAFTGSSSTINTTTQTILPGTSFQKVVAQVFTSSGTYTPTAGMKYCIVESIGGGGAGGGCAATGASTVAASAGGGAGGYVRKTFTAATIGTSQTVTIGTAGTPGSAGAVNGGNGGNTTFGALLTAGGGTGGGGAGASVGNTVNGSAGGSATGGDVNIVGNFGGNSLYSWTAGTGTVAMFGQGGAAPFGGASTASGAANSGAGGAGKALSTSASAVAGNAGAAGIVIVTEYV